MTRATLRLGAAALLALSAAPGALAADPDLTIFEWSGYEEPEFHRAYAERHGTLPTFTFFADEEEAFQKLRAGFRADAAHPCSQSIPRWRDAGLIEPIDPTRIAAWNDLIPDLRDLEGFWADGKPYIVPIDWGNTLLIYRTDQVPEEDVRSLKVLADPKYQGRVSIGDNVDDAYALGFLAIGVKDWTDVTDEQFKAASDFLRAVHKNVRLYWTAGSELAEVMASGEVLVAWSWNEAPTTMAAEGLPVAIAPNVAEGRSTYVCGLVNLVNGPGSEDKLYDFINAWLEDRSAEHLVVNWGYGHANASALGKLDPAIVKERGFSDLESFKAGTLWQAPVPPELRERMIAEFERIKAGF